MLHHLIKSADAMCVSQKYFFATCGVYHVLTQQRHKEKRFPRFSRVKIS